jgi:CheY-like chemotaxis protein
VQVFTNLVSNAVKFSPKGETVTVSVETGDAVARVKVADRGPGIPPEFQGRIFGKFQQAARPDARRSGGTGLGLTIARAIVELHGGSIRFETVPGGGTTFIVELPYAPLPAVRQLAKGWGAGNGRKLMVVDEDVGMLSVLEALCQPLGQVATVRSAEEALTLARTQPFDALIVDPQLPGMSGLELVRRLRNQHAYLSTPVLVFSAREYTADDLEGITLSPAHAFVKSRDREQDLVLRLLAVLTARGR